MAGQYGNKNHSVRNLEVVSVDKVNNRLLIKGSVPGPKNGIIFSFQNSMKLDIYKIDGSKSDQIILDDSVFGIKPNTHVVHQAVVSELSNSRQGTHSTKNRSMVRGGGKKPWKQKGRGVARAGTNRSPLWKGGGTVFFFFFFGPEPHSYTKKTTKKMRLLARKSVLSDKIQNKKFIVIDDISLSEPKTKLLASLLLLKPIQKEGNSFSRFRKRQPILSS